MMPLKTEFETGLPNHRKTWKLAAALGHSFTATAVGIIHNLHDWAVNAGIRPPGVLPDQPDALWDQIFSCGIPAAEVLKALELSGWLDVDGEDGDYRLHEWETYAGAVFGRMDASAKRKADYRDKMRKAQGGNPVVPNVSRGQGLDGDAPGTGTGQHNQPPFTKTTHHSPLTTHHDHSPVPKSLSVVSGSKSEPAQNQDAPIGLEDSWGHEPKANRIDDAWADFDAFMAALPHWRNRGPKRPMGVRQWFEGQTAEERATAIQFARDFGQWATGVPSSRLAAIPGPSRLLADGWDLDAVQRASEPLAANRETKLIGQIGAPILSGEEIAESWKK